MLLTQKQLSEHLGGVSIRTLERWRVQGQGPKFVKVGRSVRYDIDDVKAWLDGQKLQSTSESEQRETSPLH